MSWCLCVVLWWKKRSVNSWVHSEPVSIFGTVPFDSIILGFTMCSLLSEIDEVLNRLAQGPSVRQQQQRVPDTTDAIGEDTDIEQPRRRVRSTRTLKMNKSFAVGELAQFLVTGRTGTENKFSEFFCRVCRKDMSVLTHGGYEMLNFQRHQHFASRHLVGVC